MSKSESVARRGESDRAWTGWRSERSLELAGRFARGAGTLPCGNSPSVSAAEMGDALLCPQHAVTGSKERRDMAHLYQSGPRRAAFRRLAEALPIAPICS
jgi:hypothetical protein